MDIQTDCEPANSNFSEEMKCGEEKKCEPVNSNFSEEMKSSVKMILLLEKYVRIQTFQFITYTGLVYSIDPITYSVILASKNTDNKNSTIIIPGHTIMNIEEIPCPSIRRRKVHMEKKAEDLLSVEEMSKRKENLLAWFKMNMLPVSENGDKLVLNNVKVLPPYGVTDISTCNPLVAVEIKKIIQAMPIDFEPK